MTSETSAARLDIEAWTMAGLDLLWKEGVDAVKVAPLAARLGVTKGSFYWHFKDREALLDAMLAHWRRRATMDIIDRLDRSTESPEARLRNLFRVPFTMSAAEWAADPLRVWGRRDPKVRAVLDEIDQIRLRYVSRLLEHCGFSPDEAAARGVMAYCYIRVAVTLVDRNQSQIMDRCEKILLGA
jgi:AcrR family transcriptional regulator